MGTRHPRPQPKHLGKKLRQIRKALGYTLDEMAEALKGIKKSPLIKGHIYRFETGEREPSLLILLEYSRVAGVSIEELVDDNRKLPTRLPVTGQSPF
jgi:transcriptional regulator with XRE-family HTH domain